MNIESKKGNLKTIKIHNTVGQLVYFQSEINAPSFQVPTSDLNSGVYFINVETTEGTAILKTIKHRVLE